MNFKKSFIKDMQQLHYVTFDILLSLNMLYSVYLVIHLFMHAVD